MSYAYPLNSSEKAKELSIKMLQLFESYTIYQIEESFQLAMNKIETEFTVGKFCQDSPQLKQS